MSIGDVNEFCSGYKMKNWTKCALYLTEENNFRDKITTFVSVFIEASVITKNVV